MKLVLVGGGGFRVPLVHRSLLEDPDRLVDRLVLHDVDPERLKAVSAVLDRQADGRPWRPELEVTTDLDHALAGADLVFSALRAGGMAGRGHDERLALRHGLIGQETVGAGGICYAMRSIPAALDLAERVGRLAPRAWVINFTNPAGVVTEAMSALLGDRVIGICDSPVGLCRRVANVLGVDAEQAGFDYVGLNHLGWLRAVNVNGTNRLPDLLADDQALRSFEEGRLFDPVWLRALGAIPNEYLHYYYYARETLAQALAQPATRAEVIQEQQRDFYRIAAQEPQRALEVWEQARVARENSYLAEARAVSGAGDRQAADVAGGGYEQVALTLMNAIAANRPSTMILNVRNRGAVPGLDADAVVEVPSLVTGNGAQPLATDPLDPHSAALVRQVKAVERTTIEAATTRSRTAFLQALANHPLVDSVKAAQDVLDSYLTAFPEFADLA